MTNSPLPVVLLHGYSASSEAFKGWEAVLEANGYRKEGVTVIHTASYKTLTNEITIKDIAEGFDRALRVRAGLNANEPFDAIVHSTGMLVIRAWLTTYAANIERRARLKHLIGLAPATFGSPLAHKGRSWLGAIFQGIKNRNLPDKNFFEPDFLESGNFILDGLELGSRFTWDLAHVDLLGSAKNKPEGKPYYGKDSTTPYVFILCGSKGYEGVSSLANTPGSDGTVRWAGCALNSRKLILDLTQDPSRSAKSDQDRVRPAEQCQEQIDIPVVLVNGKDHGTIMSVPVEEQKRSASDSFLVEMVLRALKVSTEDEFESWKDDAAKYMKDAKQEGKEEWQQFIIRVVDERNDPVTDWNVQFYKIDHVVGKEEPLQEGSLIDVHTYSGDKSLRCFHVNLTKLKPDQISKLIMRLIVSSGSQLVAYYGVGGERITDQGLKVNRNGVWDAKLDLTHWLNSEDIKIFFPYTTTLLEIRVNREPLPRKVLEFKE